MANQESDLVALLKRLPLGPMELGVIRDKAEKMRLGTLKSRGEALLPLMLASFLFDALVIAGENLFSILSVTLLVHSTLVYPDLDDFDFICIMYTCVIQTFSLSGPVLALFSLEKLGTSVLQNAL